MIINSRADLDTAPTSAREKFMAMLAATINRWQWNGDDWVPDQHTGEIDRFGFTLADFPDAPAPEKPSEPYREPPESVPGSITMRQLLIGLMGAGWITPAEADAWSADGTLPATITKVIDALPTEAERVAARITARKMSSAYRNDPLLIAAAHAAMPDASEQEISDTLDEAFREWSQI